MGLGSLASRVVKPSSRLLTSQNPRNLLHFRPIFSTTELHNADASAAAQPQADPAPPPPPPRTPLAGARVHFSSPEDAIEVFVDGYPVKVPKGMTVLQACEIAGVDIPRFCYHSRLSIAGNCRMCLVEVEKSPKPVASCAMPALPGMKIKTDTPLAKKAREGVMEFLLMNHPLDCPICDQGGECDLQDQSMAFGSDRGRFTDVKRSVVDKNLGPLVKTVMTRCIQCTRCVRFATEVAGVQDLGMLGRGSGEEIGTYVEKLMTSELSGNVIDICPVGALTSKPFAFKARNWELKGTETIDVTDAVGSNIRIDSRGPEVMRIVPRLNEDINEEWISDKTRFCYDGLKRQRLNDPMIRGADGRFKAVSWRDALALVAEAAHQVKPEEVVGIAGKLSDAESMIALKDLLNRLGSNNVWCEGNGPQPNADLRSGYIMNTGITGLEKADVFLLIGTQPRVEAAMINARIRKTVRATQAKVGYVGPPAELNYDHQHLGTGPQTLVDIVEGRHPFCSILKNAKNPAIIVGAGLFERKDKDAIFSVVENIAKQNNVVRPDWNGYNVLLLNASQAAALDLGLVPESVTSIESAKFVYLMGADDVELEKVPKDAFVVYQGHHGDRGVYRANVILPAAAFSEKEGTYENTEGCAQQTLPAVPTVGDARDDWKIIRALSEVAGLQLPYDSLGAIRSRIKTVAPNLLQVDEREAATFSASIKPESTQFEFQFSLATVAMAEIKSGEGEMRRKLSYGGSIPLLGLGTFTYDERDSLDAVAMKAIKIGYRHFDTASLYGSEEAIGKAIKKAIENETVKREDIFVTTKLWCNEHHDPLSALNASLKRLGLDYVDSYLIHWPVKLKPWASYMVPKEDDFDEMDLETTWNHMEKCVELGLTKTIGVSNFSSKKLLHLLDFASLPPAINQVEMHVMWRQRKLREVCSSRNVHLTAYSPLGSPWNPYGLKNLLKDPIVNSIASKHEATPAQVALSWILSMGGSAVVKSFNESRLEENMASFGLKLDEQDLQEIDKLEEKKMATGEFLINATTGQYKNIQELWDGEI